jgi:hypothetical protein
MAEVGFTIKRAHLPAFREYLVANGYQFKEPKSGGAVMIVICRAVDKDNRPRDPQKITRIKGIRGAFSVGDWLCAVVLRFYREQIEARKEGGDYA